MEKNTCWEMVPMYKHDKQLARKTVVLMDVVMNVMNFLRIRYNIVDCANTKKTIIYIYCRLLFFLTFMF